MKILIVEDDNGIAEMLRKGLTSDGYTVDVSIDGADGSFMARSYEYDAIILDYSLPKKNGLVVCKEIREAGKSTPIIFLSVNDDLVTKVSALDHGADDYVTKPFSLGELIARIRAVVRRPTQIIPTVLNIGDLTLYTDKHVAVRGKEQIHHLTRKEFSLLEYFMRNIGTILSRALIMEHVWTADSDPFSNTVEAHIRNVRNKINTGNKPNLIANVPGRGYIMDTPENVEKYKR